MIMAIQTGGSAITCIPSLRGHSRPAASLELITQPTLCECNRSGLVSLKFPFAHSGWQFRVGSITLIQSNYNYSLKCFNYITITPCKKYQITITTFWFVFTFSHSQKLLDWTWWTLRWKKFLTPVNFFMPYKSYPQLKKLFLMGLMLLLVPNNPWLKKQAWEILLISSSNTLMGLHQNAKFLSPNSYLLHFLIFLVFSFLNLLP